MHIQVTKFNLRGMSVEDYERTCDQLAYCFANVDGLIKKYWLKNSTENIYGCIYIWDDIAYMEAFSKTELFKTITNHPSLENVKSTDFEVINHPTLITRGLIIEDYLDSKVNKKDVYDQKI